MSHSVEPGRCRYFRSVSVSVLPTQAYVTVLCVAEVANDAELMLAAGQRSVAVVTVTSQQVLVL